MKTVLKIGPRDHGRPLNYEDFETAEWELGYQYELIDGKLYVSPVPNPPQNILDEWIGRKLIQYAAERPTVINYVSSKARVFIPGRRQVTNPEPDRAVYHDFPLHLPFRSIRWQDVEPLLVVEIVSPHDPYKDLIRNLELYLQAPSIKEYWVVDGRANADQPTLIVHRRHGSRWKIIEVPYGGTYETRLLPGFKLFVDPRK